MEGGEESFLRGIISLLLSWKHRGHGDRETQSGSSRLRAGKRQALHATVTSGGSRRAECFLQGLQLGRGHHTIEKFKAQQNHSNSGFPDGFHGNPVEAAETSNGSS